MRKFIYLALLWPMFGAVADAQLGPLPGDKSCWTEALEPMDCPGPPVVENCEGACLDGECPAPEEPEGIRGVVSNGKDLPDPDDQSGGPLGYASESTDDDAGYHGIRHDYECYVVTACECVGFWGAGGWNYRCSGPRSSETGTPYYLVFWEGDYELPCDQLGPPQ